MKRLFLVITSLSVIFAMALIGTGCAKQTTQAPGGETPTAQPTQEAQPEPTNTPTPETTTEEPVKITVFVGFGTGTEPDQMALHEELAQEFNASHPGIEVEFLTVPYDEHVTKFSTLLAGGMAPDLVMPIGVQGIAEFYDEWLDIRPYIERDNYDLSDFYGPTVDLHTYPDKMVGLPLGVYPSVVYYNEELFDAAGLDYPPHKFGEPYADGDPWTYEKLREIAMQLTVDANGNTADSPDFAWEQTEQWGWNGWDWLTFRLIPAKFGGNNLGVSEDYKTAEMNSPAWVEGMQYVADNVWTYHIRPTGEQSGVFADAGDPMGSGMVAMWETFSWMSYAWPEWTGAFHWNVAAIPAGPYGDIVAEINADTFAIPKSSKHPDEAWEVAKWFAQPEILKRLAESYGCIPARKSLADGWLEAQQEAYPDVDFQVFLDSIEYLDDPNHEAWVPNYGKVWDAIDNALQLVLTGENTNVQEVMDNLNAEVQGYLDEYWAAKGE